MGHEGDWSLKRLTFEISITVGIYKFSFYSVYTEAALEIPDRVDQDILSSSIKKDQTLF